MFDTIDGKILRSFEIVRKVGQGAYGQVWKVRDKKTSQFCALKKIYEAFRNATDAQRAYREIKYLQRLNHPNIIKLISFHRPESSRDIYLALQFMEADLGSAIKNNVLKEIHKHFIFFQIANAVHYLHTAQLIHRDIKPSNILVNENCQVKICDFGLIRSIALSDNKSKPVLTENIATRWYRAP